MRRQVALTFVLIVAVLSSVASCTVPRKPTVSFSWHATALADGVMSGQDATYSFKAANFPADSTMSLQRLQGGEWTTVNTAFAKKSGTGTTRPPLGRDRYRLVLSNFSGATLASAGATLDVYDNFPFSTIFSIPRKHLNGFRSFDYDFRDSVSIQKTSCLSYQILVNNESPTPETLRLVYTFLGQTTPTVENLSIDRAVGEYSIGRFVRPGFDWSITAEGADLYIEGTGTCFTSDGRM